MSACQHVWAGEANDFCRKCGITPGLANGTYAPVHFAVFESGRLHQRWEVRVNRGKEVCRCASRTDAHRIAAAMNFVGSAAL